MNLYDIFVQIQGIYAAIREKQIQLKNTVKNDGNVQNDLATLLVQAYSKGLGR